MESKVAARWRAAVDVLSLAVRRSVPGASLRGLGRDARLPVARARVDLGCAKPANAGRAGGVLQPPSRSAVRCAASGRRSARQAEPVPQLMAGPDRAWARPDPVGLQAGRPQRRRAGRSRWWTPTTTPRPPRIWPRTARPTACRRARRPTAASSRSTRTAPPARCPPATTAGPRRRASTSTRSRPRARPATSCWWRPTRPTPSDLATAENARRQGGRRGGHLQQLRRLGGLLGDVDRQRLQPSRASRSRSAPATLATAWSIRRRRST